MGGPDIKKSKGKALLFLCLPEPVIDEYIYSVIATVAADVIFADSATQKVQPSSV